MSDGTLFIGPMTEHLINQFVDEMKKKKNRDKIMHNVVDPILEDIDNRYFPYLMLLIVLLIVMIILLILLFITNNSSATNMKSLITKIDECCSSNIK